MVHLTGRFRQTLRPNTGRFGYFLPSPVTGERRRGGYLIAGRLRLEPWTHFTVSSATVNIQ